MSRTALKYCHLQSDFIPDTWHSKKTQTRTSQFYVQFCFIKQFSPSSSGHKGNASFSSKSLMKVFLSFKSDGLQKYKNENNLKLLPSTLSKFFTIPLISKNNEFAEAYLDVRSHHPFLPVSDLLAYLSKLKCFFSALLPLYWHWHLLGSVLQNFWGNEDGRLSVIQTVLFSDKALKID